MASAGIPSLVDTVRKKAKFKQLAMFSIQAITNACKAPFRDWEQNLEECIQCNGVEALIMVLKKHPGHPGIFRDITDCLTALVTDMREVADLAREAAQRIAAEGGVEAALASMNVDKTYMLNEVGDKLFGFLRLQATQAPESVLEGGGAAFCLEMMQSCDAWALVDCFGTMSLLFGEDGSGAVRLAEDGAVGYTLEILEKLDANAVSGQREAMEAAFAFFANICANPGAHGKIKDADGVDRCIDIIDRRWENKVMLKYGGQIISRTAAADSPEGALGQLGQAWSEEKREQMESAAMMIAQMAMERGKASAIVRGGGVQALVGCINKQATTKTLQASARALARLATAKKGEFVKEIVKEKAIKPMVEALSSKVEKIDASAAALTMALCALANGPGNVEKIHKDDGVENVIQCMAAHPDVLDNMHQGLKFIEALAAADFDMNFLVDNGAIGAVLSGMQEHPGNAALQRDATRALLFMGTDEVNVAALVDNGTIDQILQNMSAFADNPDVHHNTLFLICSLALVEGNVEKLKASGCLTAVSSSLRLHPTDSEVRQGARETLQLVASQEDVQGFVVELQGIADGLDSGEGADSEDITRLSHTVGALAVVKDYAANIISSGSISVLARILNALAQQPSSPELEESMAACTYALTELAKACSVVGWPPEQVVQIVQDASVVVAVVNAVKGHPQMTEYVEQAATAVRSLVSIDGMGELVVESAAIEAFVYAIRANPTNASVLESSSLAFQQLAKVAKLAPAVASRGATRQLLASLAELAGRKGFAKVVEEMLNVLETVGLQPDGRDAIGQQDGVQIVGAVMDKYEHGHEKGSAAVAAACHVVLELLMQSEHVKQQMANNTAGMSGFSSQLTSGNFDINDVLAAIDQIGAMAMVGRLGEQEGDGGATGYLLQLVQMALQMPESSAKSTIVSRGVRALGRMGDAMTQDELEQAVPLILGVCRIEGQENAEMVLVEAVRAVQGLASVADEALLDLLTTQGAVETLGELLKVYMASEPMVSACYHALAPICLDEQAVARAYGTEVLIPSAASWLQSNGASGDSSAVSNVILAMSNIARAGEDGGYANAVFQAGVVDAVSEIANAQCADKDQPNIKVLHATAEIVASISVHGGLVGPLLEKGVANVLEIASETPEYADDADCMRSVLEFIRNLCAVPGQAEQATSRGAKEVTMATMAAHPFDEDLLSEAAQTLQVLEHASGVSPLEALNASLQDFQTVFAEAKVHSDDPEVMEELKNAILAINARLLVPGSVDQATADMLMPTILQAAQEILQMSKSDGPEAESALNCLKIAVQAIGRIGRAPGVTVDTRTAVPVVVRALAEQQQALAESAIHCLGHIAADCDAATVHALSSAGAVSCITQALQSSKTRATAQLRGIAVQAMQNIRGALQANASKMVLQEGGTDALFKVLCATALDSTALGDTIEAICVEEGGASALLEVMSSGDGNFEVHAEVVKVLAQQNAKEGVEIKVMNVKQMSGVVRTLQQASKIRMGGEGLSKKEIAESAIVTAGSLAILNDATASEETSILLVEGGGVEGIVQVIEGCAGDSETLIQCLQVLCNLAKHESEALTTKLAEAGVAKALLTATKSQPESVQIADLTIKLLNYMQQVAGVERSGLDREAMLMVMKLIELHPDSSTIKDYGPALLSAIQEGLGGDASSLAIKYAIDSVKSAEMWSAVWDPNQNRHYYFNNQTQETQWDQPAEYGAMVESIVGLERDVLYDGMEDPQVVEVVITAMTQHGSSNVEVVKSVIRILSRMMLDQKTLTKLSEAPGAINSIVGLVQANNANPHDHADMVEPCLNLVYKLSSNETFKGFAASSSAIQVIINSIMANMHVQATVLKCTNILVKLSIRSDTNMQAIVQSGGVSTMQSVAQSYPTVLEVLQAVLLCLSNIMHQSDENKTIICNQCGEEVLNIIRRLPHEASVLKEALRCIGNLTTDDANILVVVRQQATQAIVNSMKYQQNDADFIEMAIQVIGNFASYEQEDGEHDEEIESSVYHIIADEGGVLGVIEALRTNSQNASILEAGMDALCNIANDPDSCEGIVSDGAVQLIVDIMQSHDWNEQLIDRTVRLLSILTESEVGCDAATENNCMQVLLLAMKDHAKHGEFLHNAGLAMVQMAHSEDNREAIRQQGGVDIVLGIMESSGETQASEEEAQFIRTATEILTRLSVDDELSAEISTKGMHVLANVSRANFDNVDMLVATFQLIVQLAFIAENLLAIVQHQGVELIFDAIEKHSKEEELMVRCIEVLDNISMAEDSEYSAIVAEAHGKDYIQEIMSIFPDNEKIQQVAGRALVTMTANESLAARMDIDEEALMASAEKTEDPLKDYRSMFTSGTVVKEWISGKPVDRHLFIPENMQSIVLKDTKKGTKKGRMMPLKSVAKIELGLGPGHKKRLMGKKAREDCAFNIVGQHQETISLTCNQPTDTERWVEALSALLDTYLNHRKWLVKN